MFSSSDDGTTWSSVSRGPIDPVGSGADHFIPAWRWTRRRPARLDISLLPFYPYPNAACTVWTWQLDAGFTTQGFMLGDYISTSFVGAVAFPAIANAGPGTPTQDLSEAMFTTSSGIAVSIDRKSVV